jgi:hypothetical protein
VRSGLGRRARPDIHAGRSQCFKSAGAVFYFFGWLALGEPVFQPGPPGFQLCNGGINVFTLMVQRIDALVKPLQHVDQRGRILIRDGFHIQHFADFIERETNAFAAQNQHQPRAVRNGIDARCAFATGAKQAFLFVKTQRARRDIELGRQIADGKTGFGQGGCGHEVNMTHLYANVNVNFVARSNRLRLLTQSPDRACVSPSTKKDVTLMKRLLVSVFALSLAAPVWAQDGAPDDAVAEEENVASAGDDAGTDNGPSEDAIGDLLDMLAETDSASVSARPVAEPCDLVPDRPDLVDCSDVDPSSTASETEEGAENPDLESLLRLDSPDDEEDVPELADQADAADPAIDASENSGGADNLGDADDEISVEDGAGAANDSPQATDTADELVDTHSNDETESAIEAADDANPAPAVENEIPDVERSGGDTSDEADADGDAAQSAADGSDVSDGADESNDPAPDAASTPEDEAESGDEAPAEDSAPLPELTLTTSTPFLTSDDYIGLRAESRGEQLEMVWTIRRENSDGEAVGETETRTLYMAPDFVRDESLEGVSIFDFLTDRHLEIDPDAETYTNTAFAAEVRRRLDTYLGLSQGGRLQDIPIGPGRSFDRFWLEAAMGIRREPVTLARELSGGDLSVARTGGLVLLTASFDIEDDETPADDTVETDAAAEESEADAMRRAAMPIDLSSDESVVFDPSQAALPINLNLGGSRITYPEATPAAQAQAELFRRWMRHALPIHPDVLSALEGAPHIPTAFSYYIISPESPAGRREVWTLESLETTTSGLRLETGLEPRFGGPDWVGENIVPTAIATREAGTVFSVDAMLEEIEQRRDADDNIGAYLVSLQEQHHFGPCPALAEAELRAVCSATSSVVAAGLGDPGFEALFGVLSGPSPSGDETLIETLQPYLDDENYAGAAARILTAKALLRWAARDPESVPDDLSPFDLFAAAIEIDPLAGAAWWEAGNALLVQRDPLGAWTVFDTGRAILPEGMIQVIALEDRLRVLAPEFFLPR